MTTRWVSVGAVLVLAAGATRGVAEEGGAESARSRAVHDLADTDLVLAWLLRDCAEGDARALTLEVLARGKRLESLFLQRLDEGRPDLADIEATASEQFRQIRARLDAGATLGLGARQRALLRRDTVEKFVARTVKRAEAAWRNAGWNALGLVGTGASAAYLEALETSVPAEKRAIDRALARIQVRMK